MADEETVIVGAGPAGLACAAALRARGCGSIILEATNRLGASWRRHYDRLHLHTDKSHSALPGRPMPAGYPKYPSRLQVIDYLESYARANSLRILTDKTVAYVAKKTDWIVETTDGDVFEARAVVIATGLSRSPFRPNWSGQNNFPGTIIHSSEYRNASALDARRILVVGFGNSAGEIALECAEAGLDVAMSVRGPVNVVPREIFGVPSATIAIVQQRFPYRMVDAVNAPFLHWRYRDIEQLGLKHSQQGPLTTMIEQGRTPLIDIGTIAKIRDGRIKMFSGIEKSDGANMYFANDRSAEFDGIVLATGYRPSLETLLPDLADRFSNAGKPARNELQPGKDNLYFCGFNAATTGLLRQIGIEALQIAKSIAATARTKVTPSGWS
ncbi:MULTISPECIES: NAD(P)/FAD-dependent oxidoreductase [unclassified Rhizobium]|uniref:flavin-containing monooxygenase n=1 Tax=unclassified Rhizobium TaxID=2613769 RepID=UPI000EA9F92A|nr:MULTISPECIES: NAD(P)/FAD-dependent oxidoreductase [unclassified Rhizobium]AYG70095.1 NAD(P)/FAD-dependent oxidoreductase [Rhizobium sp. CCGE531]AYG76470.1 NAD(P)/FAD-dependent oxidoreductase [Rhizobium sp. CCGE532]